MGPQPSLETESHLLCVFTSSKIRCIWKFHVLVVQGRPRKFTKKQAARAKLLFCLLREIIKGWIIIKELGRGGGVGGDFKTFKIDARRFFLEHVIKVGIFFFSSKSIYIFLAKILSNIFCY